MGRARGLLEFLNAEEMDRLHNGALKILEEVGMKIEHPEALNYLEKFGCLADRNTNVVRFPRKLVESVVEKMRRDYTLTDRNGIVSPMRYTEMYMSTVPKRLNTDFTANAGGFPAYVLDLDGKRRQADMQDVIDSIRLADSLENIDLIGLPCSAQEIPYDMRPIAMTAELLKNTAKPGGIEAWTKKDIKYITEMAKVFRKDMDDLKRRPFLIGYGEVRSPLCLDYNMCEIFMEYVKMGLPQSFDTMPSGGSTAPATSAGTLVLGIAETLLGLILGYSIDENAWVSIDMNPSLTDMRTMIFPYAGADRLPLLAASNQMMRDYYGRPGGCHGGKTDACYPGVQAGFEKAMSILFPVLAGATGIGTLGQLEGGVTFSFVQLVIDDEIVGYIKHALKGFEVTDETLALDVIKDVGIGGNFLQHEHTALNFRNDFYLSDLLERMPWSSWERQEIKGLEEKAREKVKKILKSDRKPAIGETEAREIDSIVRRAMKE
jgi:trimethylamine--corrinoid protein Co-methyltransferase